MDDGAIPLPPLDDEGNGLLATLQGQGTLPLAAGGSECYADIFFYD
jgi:hypothetical protein